MGWTLDWKAHSVTQLLPQQRKFSFVQQPRVGSLVSIQAKRLQINRRFRGKTARRACLERLICGENCDAWWLSQWHAAEGHRCAAGDTYFDLNRCDGLTGEQSALAKRLTAPPNLSWGVGLAGRPSASGRTGITAASPSPANSLRKFLPRSIRIPPRAAGPRRQSAPLAPANFPVLRLTVRCR
jgi:hypothetical protein